ncbi:zinc finger protein 74 [Sigmodon hispidus]
MDEDVYKAGLSRKLILKHLKRLGRMGASLGNEEIWELQEDTEVGSQAVLWKPALIASGDLIKETSPRGCPFSSQQGSPTEEHSLARCSKDTQSTEELTQNHQRTGLPSGEPRQCPLEHMQSWVSTDIEENLCECSRCGKGFLQPLALAQHLRWHSLAKAFKCHQCNKAFPWSTNLVEHQRSHTGEKPFFCSECGKAFSCHSCLNMHHRIHTGERPYKCGPARRPSAAAGAECTPGERLYECTECDKVFNQCMLLTGHLCIHTDEKPYKCPQCGQAFS